MKTTKRIVIIGGGASGLMASVSAAEEPDTYVTVIEKNDRPARKLMITGKGRCNVTNNSDVNGIIKNIPKNFALKISLPILWEKTVGSL